MKVEPETALAAIAALLVGIGAGVGISVLLKKQIEIVEITETGEEKPVKRITTWTTL